MNMAGMNLSITIPRVVLIDTLTQKQAALVVEWDAEIAELNSKYKALPVTAKALQDWYVEVASMLAAGEAKVSARGDLKATDEDVKEVPDKPTVNSTRGHKKEIEYEIGRAEDARDRQLANIATSLRLLNLATNLTVEVGASEYEQLLNQGVGRSRYY
jgi:hypothetical protein